MVRRFPGRQVREVRDDEINGARHRLEQIAVADGDPIGEAVAVHVRTGEGDRLTAFVGAHRTASGAALAIAIASPPEPVPTSTMRVRPSWIRSRAARTRRSLAGPGVITRPGAASTGSPQTLVSPETHCVSGRCGSYVRKSPRALDRR